ncbi:ROK family transcriptional regulator [Streptomyces sp. NBC_00873]|uniref:ROK family transcriptional regulator n=1 Tax=unclassified Streptomyces TaxID=2593676 RepID=UPI003867622D|nr:ROK family transcriptional regulator [Streptomyces sp. NBC_00873]WSY96884.1 ROK family transcriptional regulator [Streptomyces sp. NBC_00873]WTA41343.1 ROK family transcriptional regulator [Streptomyces sp. NBC_00842]WTA48554.1 ROK family transcriptional regulator [Streptomyces sp. NBC_00842]
MRQAGTNLPKVGRYNRAVVLEQIQLSDGISRLEIAQHTGLTAQSVSGIVRKLIDEGIVREDGASRVSKAGKPRTTLRINADAGSAVGLHFDPAELACVVVDLLGEPLATKRVPTPAGAVPADSVAAMADLVADVLEQAAVPRERVLGLGLACPGPIDLEHGIVVAPPQLAHWNRVPIKQMLSEATGLAVTLDNDSTAAAVGERWAGAGRGAVNFAYFFFGTGIGGGLVLNHQVYRGGSFNAAEFGHQTVLLDGPECYCGNRGCLETLVSPAAIVAETHRRLGAGGESSLAERFGADPALVDNAAINDAVAAGDPLAAAVLDQAARYVSSVVVNVVNATDVDLVVLGGHGIRNVEKLFVDTAQSAVSTRAMSRHIRVVDVTMSPLGADAAVVGAAALVLHTTYSPQLSALLSD